MAFFFSIRRSSLLLTCQRLRRTVLITSSFVTFLRKRLSNCSWLSLGRSFTVVNPLTPPLRKSLYRGSAFCLNRLFGVFDQVISPIGILLFIIDDFGLGDSRFVL